MTIHRAPPMGDLESVYREMYRKTVEGAYAVVAVSDGVMGWIEKEFGVPGTVIPLSASSGDKQRWGEAIKQYLSIYENAVKT